MGFMFFLLDETLCAGDVLSLSCQTSMLLVLSFVALVEVCYGVLLVAIMELCVGAALTWLQSSVLTCSPHLLHGLAVLISVCLNIRTLYDSFVTGC